MKKFNELPFLARLAIMVGIAAAVVVGGEYLYLNDMVTANNTLRDQVTKLQDENRKLAPIETRFRQIKAENEQLEQQLANLRSIVPEDKEADGFIRMVQEAGTLSGIRIRSFKTLPVVQKEFYAEMPFDLSLDGSFYTVLQFFDRMAKLSRISNVSNLAMGPVTGGVRGARKYKYAPNETVIASCKATTFFAKEQPAAPPKR